MAEAAPDPTVTESINNELQQHYQRLVDAYRPDLKEDLPPGEPIFHTLNPCHLNEQMELDKREIRVADLLTTQLQESENELPRRLLLLGRPESGKTALFALILHHWLHGKNSWIKGLKDFDFLLAVQCLGLQSLSSDGQAAVDLEKHMLDHLPNSVEKYGKEVVQQAMRRAKVLIMIDSLDFLDGKDTLDEKTSLAPWSDRRVILFCRYKFMKDDRKHVFFSEQSKDNLVLKLWGGMAPNPFEPPQNTHEDISELGGVFSEKLLEDYCTRLSKCKNKDDSKFKDFYRTTLKYLAMDMRKPFNIYLAMQAFCNDENVDKNFDVKTQSQLYGKWLEIWSKSCRTSFHKSKSDPADITDKGITFLKKLAYKAFTSENEYISHEQIQEHDELVDLLSHFLLPHYNPHGKVQHFTFRIAAHRLILATRQMITEIIYGRDLKDIVCDAEFKKLEPMLPMILGEAKGREFYDKLKGHCMKIAEMNWKDHMTQTFRDPIINYVVTILSETRQFSDKHDQSDPFITQIIQNLPQKNWCIVDGNMHPEALRALCEGGQDKDNKGNSKPQKLNILLGGSPNDMPGLKDILKAVEDCDTRITLSSDRSFLDEKGKLSLDKAVFELQGKGKASLASFTGYLKEVKKLDAHPATRRTYKVSLRICSNKEYEELREMCKSSHKLNQVTLRISNNAEIDFKKFKELPTNISHLTVYLEGFDDENVQTAISIWKSIQGKSNRKVRHLRFWDIPERKLSPNSVKKIIEANLLATRIEVPLEQHDLGDLDKEQLQKALNLLQEDKYVILLKGSFQYRRENMRKEKIESTLQ